MFQYVCILVKIECVKNHGLYGFNDRIYSAISSEEACIRKCLEETSFLCMSVDYKELSDECYCSKETRYSRPDALKYFSMHTYCDVRGNAWLNLGHDRLKDKKTIDFF